MSSNFFKQVCKFILCELFQGLQKIGMKAESFMIPEDKVFLRKSLLSSGKKRKTIVVWVKDVTKVLRMFSETAMFCHQKVEVGVYQSSDRYVQV